MESFFHEFIYFPLNLSDKVIVMLGLGTDTPALFLRKLEKCLSEPETLNFIKYFVTSPPSFVVLKGTRDPDLAFSAGLF